MREAWQSRFNSKDGDNDYVDESTVNSTAVVSLVPDYEILGMRHVLHSMNEYTL